MFVCVCIEAMNCCLCLVLVPSQISEFVSLKVFVFAIYVYTYPDIREKLLTQGILFCCDLLLISKQKNEIRTITLNSSEEACSMYGIDIMTLFFKALYNLIHHY